MDGVEKTDMNRAAKCKKNINDIREPIEKASAVRLMTRNRCFSRFLAMVVGVEVFVEEVIALVDEELLNLLMKNCCLLYRWE